MASKKSVKKQKPKVSKKKTSVRTPKKAPVVVEQLSVSEEGCDTITDETGLKEVKEFASKLKEMAQKINNEKPSDEDSSDDVNDEKGYFFSVKSDDGWCDDWKPEDTKYQPKKYSRSIPFIKKKNNIPPPGYSESCVDEIAEKLAEMFPDVIKEFVGSSIFDDLVKLDKLDEAHEKACRDAAKFARNQKFIELIRAKANRIFLTALVDDLDKIEDKAYKNIEFSKKEDVGEE